LLADVGTILSPDAADAFQAKLGPPDLANNPLRPLYDSIKTSSAEDQDVSVTVLGILPKGDPAA
jgi:hypothetical protein